MNARVRSIFSIFVASSALTLGAGCLGSDYHDPRTVDGMIEALAEKAYEGDKRALYKLLDAASRHALISIVADRQKARVLVEADYPEPERSQMLERLGDAAVAKDAADLFAARCPKACLDDITSRLGAARRVEQRGERTIVETTRGQLELSGGGASWYGLVWQPEALGEERARANRDLRLIEENAATYRRRRALAE